jgi:ABC-type phosphate transport system substrate-binding protein
VVLGGVAVGLVGVAPAGAVANEDNAATTIWLVGSDTTFLVMQALSSHYAGALGCRVEAQPGTGQVQPYNTTCVDIDPVTPGLQVSYDGGISNANPDHDIPFNFYPTGSSNGVNQLALRGQPGVRRADIARSSRTARASDPEGLQFTAFAKEGQSWIKYDNTTVPNEPSDGVTNLPTQVVKNIWLACDVDTTTPGTQFNWTDLGGASSGPIVVWVAQPGSGTRPAWDSFIGAPNATAAEACIPAAQKDGNPANGERVIFENQSVDLFQSTPNDCPEVSGLPNNPGVCMPYSIFHYSTARFVAVPVVSGDTEGFLGSIQGVAPTFANIQNDTFPFTRNVFNVTRDGCADSVPPEPACGITTLLANEATRQFVDADINNDNNGDDPGWLCRPASATPINPKTGKNYREEIEDIIKEFGFVPLALGPTGGGISGNSMCRVVNSETVD